MLDRSNGKELASIPSRVGPLAILLDAPRKRLYVTNRKARLVTASNGDAEDGHLRRANPLERTSAAFEDKRVVRENQEGREGCQARECKRGADSAVRHLA